MKIGIVGLPNVGKSTIFNALTSAGAESANYPFCTIDSNIGVVAVPDERLDVLGEMYNTKRKVPTTIEFVDIAGLVKGASQGEGLGNQFLANIREVDAICHVVRCFDDENIVHVSGRVSPADDVEVIDTELSYADLEVIERRLDKEKRASRGNSKEAQEHVKTLQKLIDILNELEKPKKEDFSDNEWEYIKELQLITTKPVLYIANVSEDSILEPNSYVKELKDYVGEDINLVEISAQIEEEISELDEEEKRDFLNDLGLEKSGLDRVIASAYELLGLQSFLTAGEDECRAWTIKIGTKAPQAAGKVHSDMERGFIRAEITNYNDRMTR